MVPKLYVIADRGTLEARGIGVGEFARQMREAGVCLLQYRDKRNGPREILRAAREIAEAFAGVDDAVLVMNDRADLAALLGWGVHVGQDDLLPEDARLVLSEIAAGPTLATMKPSRRWGTQAGGLVGISTHNEPQVREADAWPVDYVAIGPVFGTSTKLDAEPVVGLEGVRRARELTAKPLVAIGGITRANAQSVIEAGADAVAVIGGLFVEGRTPGEVAADFLSILG